MKIEAVIYDMDGVLINSEPLWREAEIATFENVGLSFTEAMCKETMGMRTHEVILYWYDKLPWEGYTTDQVEKDLLQRVTQLIQEKGMIMQGVISSLDFFKSKGYKIALASSSNMSLINAVIKKLNITSYFECVHSAENLNYGKPHPEIFINAANDLKVKPTNCLVIEDSFHGLLAAKSALMKTVVVPDEESWNDPRFIIADHKLNNLTEIPLLDFA